MPTHQGSKSSLIANCCETLDQGTIRANIGARFPYLPTDMSQEDIRLTRSHGAASPKGHPPFYNALRRGTWSRFFSFFRAVHPTGVAMGNCANSTLRAVS
jgi:hypothetical protein